MLKVDFACSFPLAWYFALAVFTQLSKAFCPRTHYTADYLYCMHALLTIICLKTLFTHEMCLCVKLV